MTTDITELALLFSKAKASVFTLEYISQFEPADIDSDDVDLRFEVDGRDTGTNVSIVDECGQAAKVIGTLVEALEKAQQRIVELQQGCENDPRIHEIIDLKERIDNLESFRTAYMEWGEKTDWVQTDKRFDVLKPWGKHRADVLKEYIQHLESRAVTVENLQESAYRAGLTAGWNLGLANNNEGFNKCLAAHTAGIKVEAE
ncbi:hypothetical protein L1R23_10935 [Klebsiella pneumoniae]|uniref:hypothetical protein n=1 Tax=Klebsiella pneumoniae TaxID=573 RepID=UPI001580C900|nr:hypothetical protein [Klebsiella pneumoniae]